MTTGTVKMMVDALEDCIDDSKQVLSDMIQTYGENYKQERVAAQRETIAKAEAALSAAKGGGWLPIESAPRDGTPILCYTAEGLCEITWQYGEWVQAPCYSTYDGCGSAVLSCKPTAWQPIPTPPKD